LANRIGISIQPDEGIHLQFQTKVPDQGMTLRPADLDFHFRDVYAESAIPEAYERLIQDAIQGDATLFMRGDEIERAWEIMDPLVAAAEQGTCGQPEEYAVGSWGPKCADAFLRREGRDWVTMTSHS
jgi:glucose-6-phosphate 1-dehydrogenase